MKDYGRSHQIGFGQSYGDYLSDLTTVFSEVYRATKANGSLWIIVDTFRKEQEVVTLPFDIASKLKSVGWILRDVIIWKKERTVPWTHSGSTKRIFEYILVFSKSTNPFKYDQDKFREIADLKKWWVRYPERYNPKGKAPEQIWSYDIPVQGSWGDHYVRHFCPLPTELVSRVIQQTTDSKQVVLDPFAGSGTVPTVSKLLDRQYIGFELNSDYVGMFKDHLKKQLIAQRKAAHHFTAKNSAGAFEKKIIELRILKFGRLVLRHLHKALPTTIFKIFIFQSNLEPTEKFKHYCADYLIHVKDPKLASVTSTLISSLIKRPPLSKFGIQAHWSLVFDPSSFNLERQVDTYYEYSLTNTHFHMGNTSLSEALEGKGKIFSPIKAEVEEPRE